MSQDRVSGLLAIPSSLFFVVIPFVKPIKLFINDYYLHCMSTVGWLQLALKTRLSQDQGRKRSPFLGYDSLVVEEKGARCNHTMSPAQGGIDHIHLHSVTKGVHSVKPDVNRTASAIIPLGWCLY